MTVARPERWDVEVVLRCSPRNARVARATVAACAALEDFSIDQVEDVRLLVDEVFAVLCHTHGDTTRLRIAMGAGWLTIEMCGDGTRPAAAVDVGVLETLVRVIAPGATVALDAAPAQFMARVRRHLGD